MSSSRTGALSRRQRAVQNGGRGRPSTFRPALADEICQRIAAGETLVAICRDAHMPSVTAVFRWLARAGADADDFRAGYARAKELRLDLMAEEIQQLSDEVMEAETVITEKGVGAKGPIDLTRRERRDAIERRKLQIDSRKFLLAKLRPNTFGERVALTGAGGGPVELAAVDLRNLSDEQLAQLESIVRSARGDAAEPGSNPPGA